MRFTSLFFIGTILAVPLGLRAQASSAHPLPSNSPSIFFSDLDSGPNTGGQKNRGAFVTIWGKGFGAARGSSTVTVGAGAVADYPIWTDTKITFQLGSRAKTGLIVVNLKVKKVSSASNGLPFTVRRG